jgi:hypothetical protein
MLSHPSSTMLAIIAIILSKDCLIVLSFKFLEHNLQSNPHCITYQMSRMNLVDEFFH